MTIANEVKDLRRSEDQATQQLLDDAERQMPDSVERRRVRGALEDLRTSLTEGLRALMQAVIDGKLSSEAATQRAIEEQFVPAYKQAAGYGFLIAGLPKWRMTSRQKDAMARLITDEAAFFQKFLTTLEMSSDQRLGMYGEGSDGAFWRGWLMTLPGEAMIWWRLSVCEHCADCLKLAADSPYTKTGANTLPTLPKNGATKCLTNCRCFLESRGRFVSGLINHVGVEVTSIGGLAVDPNLPRALAAAALYLDLVERYAFFTRLAELLSGAQATGYAALAKEMLRILKEQSALHGHSVRLTVSRGEILEPLRIAQAMGWRFIPPDEIDDDLLLAIAIVIGLNDSDRGKITALKRQPPSITLDDDPDRTYRLDASGRNILFLEKEP